MTQERHRSVGAPPRSLWSLAKVSLLFLLSSACGSSIDDRFSAETYDEYTEPLTNVTIGTRETMGATSQALEAADGGSADAGVPPPPDGTSGTGGSSGTTTTGVGDRKSVVWERV